MLPGSGMLRRKRLLTAHKRRSGSPKLLSPEIALLLCVVVRGAGKGFRAGRWRHGTNQLCLASASRWVDAPNSVPLPVSPEPSLEPCAFKQMMFTAETKSCRLFCGALMLQVLSQQIVSHGEEQPAILGAAMLSGLRLRPAFALTHSRSFPSLRV